MKTHFQVYQMPPISRVLRYMGVVNQGVLDHVELAFGLETPLMITLRVTVCMRAKHKNEFYFIAYSKFSVQR